MPEKKKILAAKARNTQSRMTKPQAPKNVKTPEPVHKNAASSSAQGSGPKQLAVFETAAKLFHARKFKDAKDLFDQAATGPERDVAQRARLHVAMCERRIGVPAVEPGSAEEHYKYCVA